MGWYALRVTQDDNGDGDTARLKKTCTNRIENFPEWLEVWNTFMFARLHYKPQEHASLLTYQKAITQFAKSHRFPAVFAYDIDFRKKIAAERQLPPEHRTTFWATQHLELKNQHLHNQWIAPVVCYTCKENGHTSRVCPNSKKFSRGSNFRPQSHSKPYPSFSYQQPSPPTNWPYSRPTPPQQTQPNFSPAYQTQLPPFLGTNFGKSTQASNSYGNTSGNSPNTSGTGLQGKGKGTCNFLNHKGFCYRGSTCPFRHACNVCGEEGTHGGINCLRNTSSSFRPQYHHQTSPNGC